MAKKNEPNLGPRVMLNTDMVARAAEMQQTYEKRINHQAEIIGRLKDENMKLQAEVRAAQLITYVLVTRLLKHQQDERVWISDGEITNGYTPGTGVMVEEANGGLYIMIVEKKENTDGN